jgi:hypothetical protein
MQHIDEEQLVLHRYGDDEDHQVVAAHLAGCETCRAQYENLCRVLTLVTEAEMPEPGPAYEEEVWNRLQWRMDRGRRRGNRWASFLAAAAVLAIAFFAGQWWHARQAPVTATSPSAITASNASPSSAAATISATAPEGAGTHVGSDRILLVVVSDHLDSSERMLMELANADPHQGLDVTQQRERAAQLVASNRIYRQTAAQRGETRIVSLLSDLEPVLVELSHAGKTLDAAEVAELQKRIDSKGLLFKVRVMGAQVSGKDRRTPGRDDHTTSL